MGKNDLKRDKRFKRHLAQQFQVEQPPQSYLQAVQDAFDSLPDELPVKARPLRTFARACATLAACAVLVAAGAFGLNRANPGLMESLPGVGQLFQQLNGTVDLPQETENHSLPTPTPIPQDPSQLEEQQAEEPPVEDNGVSLQWVESTPTNLRFSVEVPFFGRMSYTMLTPAEEADFATSAAPLGIYPLLSTPEGDLLQDSSVEWSPNSLEDVYYAGPYTGVGTFNAPAEDVPYVVLTLYEYPPYSTEEGATIANNRVVAEFTIDLETRQVYASQHYRDQGLEKLSLANSLKEDRTPTPVNGYICADPSLYGDPLQVALFTPDLDYHPVAVYCYSGDALVCIAYSHPQNEYNSYEETGDGTELAYYEDENGSYRADIIASPTIQGGQTYKRMQFRVYNTAGIEFTRLELVDVETGQVLIEDIQRAYYHQADEVFGTQLEAYQYGEAAVEPSPSPPAVESRLQEDASS